MTRDPDEDYVNNAWFCDKSGLIVTYRTDRKLRFYSANKLQLLHELSVGAAIKTDVSSDCRFVSVFSGLILRISGIKNNDGRISIVECGNVSLHSDFYGGTHSFPGPDIVSPASAIAAGDLSVTDTGDTLTAAASIGWMIHNQRGKELRRGRLTYDSLGKPAYFQSWLVEYSKKKGDCRFHDLKGDATPANLSLNGRIKEAIGARGAKTFFIEDYEGTCHNVSLENGSPKRTGSFKLDEQESMMAVSDDGLSVLTYVTNSEPGCYEIRWKDSAKGAIINSWRIRNLGVVQRRLLGRVNESGTGAIVWESLGMNGPKVIVLEKKASSVRVIE